MKTIEERLTDIQTEVNLLKSRAQDMMRNAENIEKYVNNIKERK